MNAFIALYNTLDSSNSVRCKLHAMVRYFESVSPREAAWAVYFLMGGKPKRTVPTKTLRAVALQISQMPEWMFEECYQATGDLAETIAYMLPRDVHQPEHAAQTERPIQPNCDAFSLSEWMENIILPMRGMNEIARHKALLDHWQNLNPKALFVFIKLVGGGFRVGVSKLLVTKALAQVAQLDAKTIATRLMGYHQSEHQPSAQAYLALISQDVLHTPSIQQPVPFFLAHPLQHMPETLGHIAKWFVEWKYDGIRAQVIKDAGQVWIWSRGEELISEQFPELTGAFANWPDGTTLDGEIIVWVADAPASFQALQTRINRKKVTPKSLMEHPVIFMAYDALTMSHAPLLDKPQSERRNLLEQFYEQHSKHSEWQGMLRLHCSKLLSSPSHPVDDWSVLHTLHAKSRSLGVEGFMLKHHEARYGVGRTKSNGIWWKWKVEPMTIDCILVYAQRGHGRRAGLYTDYTFAVWSHAPLSEEEVNRVAHAISQGIKPEQMSDLHLPKLVPFAKAYSGLSDHELKRVDQMIRKHTVEKFGPVRTVVPTLMVELGFEGIARSSRHKSGVAVRFPRILRIREDKPLMQADTLETLQSLLNVSAT